MKGWRGKEYWNGKEATKEYQAEMLDYIIVNDKY